MGRGGGRTIKMKQKKIGDIDTKELNTMFAQMIGGGKIDPDIALNKFLKIKEHINNILNKLRKFNTAITSKLILIDETRYTKHLKEINNFIEDCNFIINVQIDLKTISELYMNIKEQDLIKEFTLLCRNLIRYKSSLNDINNLCAKFIYATPGSSGLELFPFSTFDFAYLFKFEDINKDDLEFMKKYILLFLHFIFKDSYDIYECINSPDIDTAKFSQMMVDSIGAARSQLPRCGKAFDLISNSTDLLTGNFNNYYKDFIQTKDSNTIVTSFISDVMGTAVDENVDLESVRQLKDIMKFIQTNNKNRPKNPEVDKLLDVLKDKMSFVDDELDKYMRDENEKDDDDDDDDGIIV